MKTFLFAASAILLTSSAHAQSQPPLLETINDARARHNADRYEVYKGNNYQAPLGGYSEKFGDPAPSGTIKPGYAGDNSLGSSSYSSDKLGSLKYDK